ncbi:MAG: hypothetical protein SXQ77_05050 [Halobacteria archaeon]|nr:hypothetical protein [Halobacteria archaeon]
MTKFWRNELYIGVALYALVTIISLFVFQGFSIDAFFRQGRLNPMAVIAKLAEAVVVVSAAYLYTQVK